jgi:DASH complex subunit DAM1
MADLEANFMHMQLMHESLARFGESFAAFLYGLNVRAFCVDFPEAPITESFERWRGKLANSGVGGAIGLAEGETTFMYVYTHYVPAVERVVGDELTTTVDRTTNTSFAEQGSTTISSKATTTPRRAPPRPVTPKTKNTTHMTGTETGGAGRGSAGGRGGPRVVRGSGLARPRGRGLR